MAYEDHHHQQPSSFEQSYYCYPVSFIEKPHLEKGDKIIMPPSALDRLASLRIDYPMLFKLNNPNAGRTTHCGVLEFVADEGVIYLPYWMMQNMLLKEGDIVRVRNTSLVKGTFVKLQPHTKDFLDISNPKAILETTLRNYSCLTTGDTIMVPYNNKNYYIDVVETKPSDAVTIIETDCEVDFAAPLDYKEPEKLAPTPLSYKKPPEVEEEPPKKMAKFNAFSGPSRRLNGKLSLQSVPMASSALLEQPQVQAKSQTAVSEPPSLRQQNSGKLVFGSNINKQHRPNETEKDSTKNDKQEAPPKVDEPKFQAFTGKKYSLKN